MITDADVAEFQSLYQKQFGRPIEKEEAFRKLTILVRQMEIVYQPIRASQHKKHVNEDESKSESERSRQTS